MKKYVPLLIVLGILLAVFGYLYYHITPSYSQAATTEVESTTTEVESAIILNAPDTCKVGELVVLDASASDVASFKWVVLPDTPNFCVIEDGKRAFFSSPAPGKYLFFLSAAKGDKVDGVIHEIIVEGGAAVVVEDAFTKLVRSWLPKDYDKKVTAALARSFEESVDAADIDTLLKTTALTNRAVLGKDMTLYMPFLKSFAAYLESSYKDKSLEEHKELWFQIAEILKSC